MKMNRGKTKRILMSILLCGAMSSSVYAEGTRITVNSGDTYTEPITGTYSNLSGETNGGAVYNRGIIYAIGAADIETLFDTNSARYGGAIYNYANGGTAEIYSITNVTFTGNTALDTDGAARGGAIDNYATNSGTAEIGSITASFSNNSATSGTTASARGGAIANYASAGGNSLIGATVVNGIITTDTGSYAIEGDFTENKAGEGGAIYNYATGEGSIAAIGDIKGSFISNETYDSSGDSDGGAIYNRGYDGGTVEIGDITGDFTGNRAIDTDNIVNDSPTAAGGAIYNCANTSEDYTGSSTSVAIIGDITGDFTGNGAENYGARNSRGGAINNAASSAGAVATIGNITGNFTDNYALSRAYAAWGGAILNMASAEGATATIGDIAAGTDENGNTAKARFSGNSATITEATNGMAAGGAIHNRAEKGNNWAIIGNITADFEENVAGATGSRNAAGGAIYNLSDGGGNAEIGTITGDFTSNEATAVSGTALGGAIYNTGTITGLTGAFDSNSATTTSGTAQGGAIYNTGAITSLTGAFTGNSAATTGGTAQGGAIYNTGSIGGTDGYTVTGLSGNTAEGATAAYGGAIYDAGTGAAIDVTGDVTGNSATASEGEASGGAIYIGTGSSITIDGNVTGNTATGATAMGGAIYNEGTVTLNGTVTGNTASGDDAMGGAIYMNNAAIGGVTGNFTGNYAKASSGDAAGGAVYMSGAGVELTLAGDLRGNYAEASGTAQGGAVYVDENTTANLSGNITGNYAKGDTAAGGAIYNAGTVNINIENQDAVISGNYTEAGGEKEANVLYGTADSVTNFDLTDATLRVDDAINGDTGYEVNVTGSGTDSATFYMLNDILDSNLSFNGMTLNTINNEVKTYSVNKLTVAGDFSMAADVDLAGETMDRFTASEYGDHAGNLNVSALNGISDTDKDRVGIYFAEPGLKENVTASVTGVTTPIYTYDVAYDKNYDGSWGDDGGYFVFEKTGENPEVMTPSVAQAGLFSAASMMYNYVFEHSEYYMNQPYHVRFEEKEAENDEEGAYHVRRESSLTERGVWVRPFASFETVPFKGKFTVRDKYYGMLLGIDGDMKDVGNGWSSVFTGYVGYQGIHQGYTGGTIRQDGGVVGVTENLYRKNFFTAVTAAGTMETADGRTSYGREKAHLYTYGLAAKAGWNLSFREGKYSFLPSFMASYTNVGMEKYKNAAGVKIDPEDMRGLQLNPNFKLIRNLKDCMPYITAGEVWTVAQKSGFKADSFDIDGYHMRPYTEFGVGVQKKWNGTGDGYLQVLGHAGGRRGMLFNLGLRWNF